MKKKKNGFTPVFRITVITFLLFFVISSIIFIMFAQNQVMLKKQRTVSDIESQGSKAQFIIESTLQKLDTLKVFVHLSNGKMEHFEETARLIVSDEKVRNIALAPHGVMENIYPLEGNEKALGLDLLSDHNASQAEAQLAIQEHSMTIAGPYELAQGGSAITGRLPVYLDDGDGQDCWGLVSLTLDMENVLDQINMESLTDAGYNYELYHINPNDNSAQTIAAGDKAVGRHYVEVKLPIMNDVWYLRAIPKAGWFPVSYSVLFLVICLVFDLLVCALLYLLLHLRDEWKEKASKDSLTHVYNHQSMEELGKELLAQYRPKQFAYMIIDVDNFKLVNDTLGHPVGDEVLILIANILKQCSGPDSLAGRPGGDEFSLLVTYNGDIKQVEELAANICRSVKRKIEKDGKGIDISCSIGIALFPEQADSWLDLQIKADAALYQSKRSEKGIYSFYTEEDC